MTTETAVQDTQTKRTYKSTWKAAQHQRNTRGPDGHWEISTGPIGDRHCVVQCVFNADYAHLIETAPDLLKELKNLIRLNRPGILEGLDEALAAIAKAEGA